MSIVDFSDLVGAYPSVQNGTYKAEDVNSYHIPFAQAELEALLGHLYTVPFSSNNIVAKDLTMRLTYARIAPLSAELRKEIRDDALAVVEKLMDGSAVMITDSGALAPDADSGLWSSTEDYHPIFTIDNPEYWVVDNDQIEAVRDERDQD